MKNWKQKISKTKAQRIHAKKRFVERYGLDFTRHVRREFCRRIQKQEKARFIERQSTRVSVWDVEYEEKIYRVVYDKIRKSIVTVLP
tara:strand:+ start:1008 stop:1268 length:261 start_codon:yes stop_codon:yes gene_type:complete